MIAVSEKVRREALEPGFYCSRAKLGAKRVFYVVWRSREICDEDRKRVACSYTATIEEAEQRMREAIRPCPETEILWSAKYALLYHRELVEEKRRERLELFQRKLVERLNV
jgi:hypothetical protein